MESKLQLVDDLAAHIVVPGICCFLVPMNGRYISRYQSKPDGPCQHSPVQPRVEIPRDDAQLVPRLGKHLGWAIKETSP